MNIVFVWDVVPYILLKFVLSFGGEYNLLSNLKR